MMSMVSCPKCGHPNAENAKFCAKCGNKLSSAETLVMGQSEFFDPPAPPTAPRPAAPSFPPAQPAAAVPPLSPKEQAAYGTPPAYSASTAYSPPPARPAAAPLPAAVPVAAAGGLAAPDSGGHRFVAMRTIAGLCNILAWVSVGLSALSALFWIFASGFDFVTFLIGVVGAAISGVLGWIFWRLLGEGIWLALDIEANTRRTAQALENQKRP